MVTVSGAGRSEDEILESGLLGWAVVSGAEVTVCIDTEAAACSVIVVGKAEVTVTTIVVGVSECVITIVDSCVERTVSVCTTEFVTVCGVVDPPEFPPSTATTEYEAGCLRSRRLGNKGHALATDSNDETDRRVVEVSDFIVLRVL